MYKEIDLSQYGVDTGSMPIEVAESHLYRGTNSDGEPLAIKTFPAFRIEQIVEYADTTNWLASVINSEPLQIQLDCVIGRVNSLVYIVPILSSGITRDNLASTNAPFPCTISPFIDGPPLFDIDTHYQSRNHGDREEPLAKLSTHLSKLSSKKGIRVIPWNVKLIQAEGENILAVTDISGSINSFK